MIFDLINDDVTDVDNGVSLSSLNNSDDIQPALVVPNYKGNSNRTISNNSKAPLYSSEINHVSSTTGAKQAYKYYTDKGVDSKVAAGIVGNLFVESNFNPNALGDNGTSHGVAQWHNERFAGLKRYANRKGKAWNDLPTQLDYVLDEDPSIIASMKGAKSNAHASQIFTNKFERPNPRFANYGKRNGMAESVSRMRYGGLPKKKFGDPVINPKLDLDKLKADVKSTNLFQTPSVETSLNAQTLSSGLVGASGLVSSFDTNTNYSDPTLSTVSGALSGAGTGASLGSTLGPFGTLVGGGIGAIVGAFSGNAKAKKERDLFEQKKKLDNQTFLNFMQSRSQATLANYPTNGVNVRQYRYGSPINNKNKFNPIVSKPTSTTKLPIKIQPAIKKEAGLYDNYISPVIQKVASTFNINAFNKTHDNYSDNLENVSASVNGAYQDGTSILGGEFVEKEKNNIKKKKDWLTTPTNATIGDRKIPLKNINTFYGIENNNFKIGKLDDFKNDTDLVPVRSKNTSVYSASVEKKSTLMDLGFGDYDDVILKDSLGKEIPDNVAGRGKLIMYSPVTKKKLFLNGNANYKASEVNKFVKSNPQSKYIMLDNGRFFSHLTNKDGLEQKDFNAYNTGTFKSGESKTYNIVSRKRMAYGGRPDYEAEHGEVIMGDDVNYTGGKQLASNLHRIEGKTHDEYNPNTVNGSGEDVQGGDFVFSHRLSLDGRNSIADIATKLARKKAKFEPKMASNDYVVKNTGTTMVNQIDTQLEELANAQENMKKKLGIMRYGGVPRLAIGGDPFLYRKRKLGEEEIRTVINGKEQLVRRKQLPANHPKSVDNELKNMNPKDSDAEQSAKDMIKSDSLSNVRHIDRLNEATRIANDRLRAKNDSVSLNKNQVRSASIFNDGPISKTVRQNQSEDNVAREQANRIKLIKQDKEDQAKVDKLQAEDDAYDKAQNQKTTQLTKPLGKKVTDNPSFSIIKAYNEPKFTGNRPIFKMSASTSMAADKTRVDTPYKFPIAGKLKNVVKTISQKAQSVAGNDRPDINEIKPVIKSPVKLSSKIGNKRGTSMRSPVKVDGTEPIYHGLNQPKLEIPNIDRPKIPNVKLDNVTSTSRATSNVGQVAIRQKAPRASLNIDPEDTVNAGLIGAGYLANRASINKFQTRVPTNLSQHENYGYFDQSQMVRNAVNSQVGSLMYNPYSTRTQRMGAFAKGLDTVNDINQAELNRKQDYNNQFRANNINVDNQNTQIINNAQAQTIDNENAKLAAQTENTNALLGNVSDYFAAKAKKRSDLQAANLIATPLRRRGLDPQQVVPL